MSNSSNGTYLLPSPATITLPLTLLRALLFSEFEELEGISPRLAPGDYARPRIIPIEIAELLAKLDPEEKLFHIIKCFHKDLLIPYAELWHIKEWNESNIKRIYSKERAGEHLKQYEQSRLINKRKGELMELIEEELGNNLPAEVRKQFAATIAMNYKSSNFTEILASLGLLETINQFNNNNGQ